MPDRVRVALYEIFRRLAGNGPLLPILAGAARRPDIAVEPVPRAVGADRAAGSPSARRTTTRCSTPALARPTRLSKHLGRYLARRGEAPEQAIGAIAVTAAIAWSQQRRIRRRGRTRRLCFRPTAEAPEARRRALRTYHSRSAERLPALMLCDEREARGQARHCARTPRNGRRPLICWLREPRDMPAICGRSVTRR
jgi:hypothetical protein